MYFFKKTIYFSLLCLCLSFQSNGQKNYFVQSESLHEHSDQNEVKSELNIHPNNQLERIDRSVDHLGISHNKYQQFINGIAVHGAIFIQHEYKDGSNLINGLWLKDFDTETPENTITESEALEKLKYVFPFYRKLAWEIKPDDAKYKPEIEQVWYDKNYSKESQNYNLCYKINLIISHPYETFSVFIDAQSGRIINKYSTMHTVNTPGSGEGLYTGGVVNFTIDSLNPTSYEMIKHNDDGSTSIRTQNELAGFSTFSSNNNTWTDQASVDCHWGTEKTLDYFLDQHNHKGLDNEGSEVLVNVHVQDPFFGGPMANAFYVNGSINIGDGNPDSEISVPLSSLDIVAHELVHGVTENEANLIYEGESGAINESMSDIFGVTVEQNTFGTYNWETGDHQNFVIRRMNDPKSLEMPAFYQGEYWVDGANVHINSSIGNLWYHYLVEGGSGISEDGNAFEIEGIGFDKAAKIAYRCLTEYLSSSSDYTEYSQVAIQAASDLYGNCSLEVQAVSLAWAAVGLGEPLLENDFKLQSIESLMTDCGLMNEELSINFEFKSCQSTIPAGSELSVQFSVDNNAPIAETYIISEDLQGGENFEYTFQNEANLSEVGVHEIKVWLNFNLDEYFANDTLELTIENKEVQNEDFKLIGLTVPEDTKLCGLNIINPIVEFQFLGCESLAAGTQVKIKSSLENSSFEQNISLSTEVQSEDILSVQLDGTLTADSYGENEIVLEIEFPNDPNEDNNTITHAITLLEEVSSPFVYPFNDPSELNTLNIKLSSETDLDTLIDRENVAEESQAILFSGGRNFIDNTGNISIDIVGNESEIWSLNPEYESRMCMCVDATEWNEVSLSFDLFIFQLYELWSWLGLTDSYYSNLRVLANGEPVSETFGFNSNQTEFENHLINLNDFAGTSFEICFQIKSIIARNIISNPIDPKGTYGDHVMLDNINVFNSDVTNTKNSLNSTEIKIYPNPVSTILNLDITSKFSQEASFEILNIIGQSLKMEYSHLEAGQNNYKINLADLVAGIYYIKVASQKDDSPYIRKIVVE